MRRVFRPPARSLCGSCHSLAGAQILTWIGAKVFQAGRIAEKVLLPFVYVTADRILAAYLHSANGVDDGSARQRLRRGAFGGAVLALSLLPHRDSVLRYSWPSPPLQILALPPWGRGPRRRFLQPVSRRGRVRGLRARPLPVCGSQMAVERIGQSPRALHHLPVPTAYCLLPFLSPKNQEYVALQKSARAKGFGDDWELTSAPCRGSPCVPAQFCAAGAFALGFESANLRKNRRPQRRRSALRLLVIIPVARAPRSLRLVADHRRGPDEQKAGAGISAGQQPLPSACRQECPSVVGNPG